jgi:DNA-binding CsgD family transcriptional regulator/tetratricopeptide (TPR) repeat protein
MLGSTDAAIDVLDQSLALFRELGDGRGCARALLVLAGCVDDADADRAHRLLDESISLSRAFADLWCLAQALAAKGLRCASTSGDEMDEACRLLEECLAVADAAGDKHGLAVGLLGMGSLALRRRDLGSAQALLTRAAVAADELGEPYGRATALRHLAEVAVGRGDHRTARALLDEGVVLTRELGPSTGVPEVLVLQGRVAFAEGDAQAARRHLEEAHATAVTSGRNPRAALQALAELAREEHDLESARRLFEEALALARSDADMGGTADALFGAGQVARAAGQAERAAVLHNEVMGVRAREGDAYGICASLEAVGGLAVDARRPLEAARLFGAADALRATEGYARSPFDTARYEADLAAVRQSLPPEELNMAWADGAGRSMDEAVAMALKGRRRRHRPSTGWASLSDMERQVAALVGDGLTNPEIAKRLFISLSTVKTHLSHVSTKLDVSGRQELARRLWDRDERSPVPPERPDR